MSVEIPKKKSPVNPQEMDPKERTKRWVTSAFGAIVCFCVGNAFISYLTVHNTAWSSIFYMSPGAVIIGPIF